MSASGTPQHQAQYNGQWNGANTADSGAVQSHNADNDYAMNAPGGAKSADAIREGKQKARETLAAAGMGTPVQAQGNGTPNGQANGGPQLSRKRSRDGSQIPIKSRKSAEEQEERLIEDEILLDRYLQRDLLSAAAQNDQAERMRRLRQVKEAERDFYAQDVAARRRTDPGTIFGTGFAGYGNGVTNGPSRILYSSQRVPPNHRKSLQLRLSRKDNVQQSEQHEELVPIRLDLELDKLRLRDTFTWNLHEKLVTPHTFTDYLLEDLKVPPENMAEVGRQIRASTLR